MKDTGIAGTGRIRSRRASKRRAVTITVDFTPMHRRAIDVMAARNGFSVNEQIAMMLRTHPEI